VSPAEFIPVAEQAGTIIQIGEYVLSQALRNAAEWKALGIEPFTVAINLSPRKI
jgi:EAL domain-containing protein (putative c-di-GMP-specific phosphodiesterase class I)